MAVPGSGTLSLAGILAEITSNAYDAEATDQASLQRCSVGADGTINENSTEKPDGNAPHSMSEFYAYDHDAAAAWTNNYAVSRSITTGSGQAIYFDTPADSTSNFIQTDQFTINIWVKVGWSSSLNTSVFLWDNAPPDHNGNFDNRIMLRYREDNNRLIFRMQNGSAGGASGNYDLQSEWLFHSNSGNYAAAYAAAGLGTTYWSASNRGNVNGDNFTMITIVKTNSTAGSAVTLYWNGTSCGTAPITADTSAASLSMHDDDTRRWAIGSNVQAYHASMSYSRAGNSAESVYNDFAVWEAALDSDNVASLYNEGTAFDVRSSNNDYDSESDLVLYYAFENTTAKTGGSDSGGTLTVAGNSNFSSI